MDRFALRGEEGGTQNNESNHEADYRRAGPAPLLAVAQGEQESEESDAREGGSSDIERLALTGRLAWEHACRPEDRQQSDRRVDQEDRAPGRNLSQDTSERRSQAQPYRDADSVQPQGSSTFTGREGPGYDRRSHGHDHGCAHTLDDAESGQGRDVGRAAATDAREREDREADQVDALEGQDLAEPAKRQQQAADDQQVGDDDPLDGRKVDPEVCLHRRKGDVDDASVQRRHQRAEGYAREDQPFAFHRFP